MEETDLDTYIHIIQSYFLSKVSVKDIQSLSGLSAVLFVFECLFGFFFLLSLSYIRQSSLLPSEAVFCVLFFHLLNLVRGCQSNCCLVIGNKIMHKMSLVRSTNLTNENICH